MDIRSRHVLVTGGAKRLGRAIAESLLRAGAKVTVHYRGSQAEADDFVQQASRQGSFAQGVKADLRKPQEITNAVATAVTGFGPIDILINSASGFFPRSADTTTEADWDELLGTNLKGQFFFAKEAARGMRERGAGVIINLADVAGTIGYRNYTAYASSKAALILMSRNLAKEWAPQIRVNSISPGPVLEPESYTEEQRNRSIERTLLKRWGTPADITEAVHFLIRNDYITGIDLRVDGGRSLT